MIFQAESYQGSLRGNTESLHLLRNGKVDLDPKKLFFDGRLKGVCIYCGAMADTRDHVPSRILLDHPYPSNMNIVPACNLCNNRFSRDEAYLACIIDCAQSGGLVEVKRKKVRDLLDSNVSLASKIHNQTVISLEGQRLLPEMNRVSNVIVKIARGHLYYECSEIFLHEPSYLMIKPFHSMSEIEIKEYGKCHRVRIFPEIGSRAFVKHFASQKLGISHDWEVVQVGRYRFMVDYSNITIKFVLSEYLACEVGWI